MAKLKDLLDKVPCDCVFGSLEVDVTDICFDSRNAKSGEAFVCLQGNRFDGNSFIRSAKEAGCIAVITEKDLDEELINELQKDDDTFTVCRVKNTREALAEMSGAYFSYPADEIIVIGITGTKGKTSTAYMIKEIFETAGISCGLMGTIETIIGDEHEAAENTTQESYYIHKKLRKMVQMGCHVCVMEVSSQGLMMQRVKGIPFTIAIFTNISMDHVGQGEHKDFADYFYWKKTLFLQCKTAVINADDARTKEVQDMSNGRIILYGTSEEADYRALHYEAENAAEQYGVAYELFLPDGTHDSMKVGIPGKIQMMNSLAAVAAAGECGISIQDMKTALKKIKIKGRMEEVYSHDDFKIIIDYAHNAISLRNLLSTVREYEPKRIVCLFGCGGNRSKMRRYEMGEVAGRLADYSIVTSDNPRREDPYDIIEDIRIGMGRTNGSYIEIIDRKKAISYAIRNHRSGDVLLLVGKGHEMTQEINGKFYPMDERKIVKEALQEQIP